MTDQGSDSWSKINVDSTWILFDESRSFGMRGRTRKKMGVEEEKKKKKMDGDKIERPIGADNKTNSPIDWE